MYFPFLTCEVKCGSTALDVADRQNAHSMTLAVRGIVELFRLMKREKELHQEILDFSISHNDRAVRIYGHYPVIDRNKTTFYRHPIREFSFTELDGKENGRHTNSPRTSMTYGCRLTSKESVRLLMSYRLIWILRSPSQGTGWKATIYLTKQLMMSRG
jgi:hypothetical protein